MAKMIQSMSMAWGFRVPVYPKISGTKHGAGRAEQPGPQPLRRRGSAIDGEDGGTGRGLQRFHGHDGPPHRVATSATCYLDLVKHRQAERDSRSSPRGGIGKNGNLAANAAALIMLGACGVADRQVHHAGRGGLPRRRSTTAATSATSASAPRASRRQDPRLYRRLDPDKVAERVVDVF
ncbi:MAG: hypothetical protein MZW92_06390 [Comamonadaceae bacterium]|nr:hypothetical protein [Comamonadaceae bacterium]